MLVSHHSLAGASTVARGVQRHEAVLLSGDTDRRHPRALCGFQPREAGADRVDPPFRALLAAAVVAGDQLQRLAMRGDDPARRGVVVRPA